MNRQDRRREFKGFEKLHGRGSYADLTPGFEHDLMVAICRAIGPDRGLIVKSDADVVNAVFGAIQNDQIHAWVRWSESGVEVKTELRVPGFLSPVPMSTFISFEDAEAA